MAYKLHNFYYIMKIGRMIHSFLKSMFSYRPLELLHWHPLFIMHNLWLMEIVMDLNKFLLSLLYQLTFGKSSNSYSCNFNAIQYKHFNPLSDVYASKNQHDTCIIQIPEML